MDLTGYVITGVVVLGVVAIVYASRLVRKGNSLDDAARRACIGVYEGFSSSDVNDLPESIRSAWEIGRQIKMGD